MYFHNVLDSVVFLGFHHYFSCQKKIFHTPLFLSLITFEESPSYNMKLSHIDQVIRSILEVKCPAHEKIIAGEVEPNVCAKPFRKPLKALL